jgi:hypothetical protein
VQDTAGSCCFEAVRLRSPVNLASLPGVMMIGTGRALLDQPPRSEVRRTLPTLKEQRAVCLHSPQDKWIARLHLFRQAPVSNLFPKMPCGSERRA